MNFNRNSQDIDECTLGLSDCGHNSICMNSIGSFTCHCNTGYVLNITTGCHAMPNICPDGIICDKNAVCKHVGGLHVSFIIFDKIKQIETFISNNQC